MRTQSEIVHRIVTIEIEIDDLLDEQRKEEGFPRSVDIQVSINQKEELKDLLNWVLGNNNKKRGGCKRR